MSQYFQSQRCAVLRPGFNSSFITVNNQVTDASLVAGLWVDLVLGVGFVLLFCILQRSSKWIYRFRLMASYCAIKPHSLPSKGLAAYWGWLRAALACSNVELLRTAGMDALVMVKCVAIGIQLLLPMTIVGCAVLLPLHYSGTHLESSRGTSSTFMRYTMANMDRGSGAMWLHVFVVYVYVAYAMLLLRWHYQQYLIMRQHYLRRGDSANYWRELHLPARRTRSTSPALKLTRAQGAASSMRRIKLAARAVAGSMKMLLPCSKSQQATTGPGPGAATELTAAGLPGKGAAAGGSKRAEAAGAGSGQVATSCAQQAGSACAAGKLPPADAKPAAGLLEQPQQVKPTAGSQLGDGGSLLGEEELGRGSCPEVQLPPSPHKRHALQHSASAADAGSSQRCCWQRPAVKHSGASGSQLLSSSAGAPSPPTSGSASLRFQLQPPPGQGPGAFSRSSSAASCQPLLHISAPHAALHPGVHAALKWWPDGFASASSSQLHSSSSNALQPCGSGRSETSAPVPVEMTLAKPSVSYRRTINTLDADRRPIAVNAQHYAVLVTDIQQWRESDDEDEGGGGDGGAVEAMGLRASSRSSGGADGASSGAAALEQPPPAPLAPGGAQPPCHRRAPSEMLEARRLQLMETDFLHDMLASGGHGMQGAERGAKAAPAAAAAAANGRAGKAGGGDGRRSKGAGHSAAAGAGAAAGACDIEQPASPRGAVAIQLDSPGVGSGGAGEGGAAACTAAPGTPRRPWLSGQQCWALARRHLRDGSLLALPDQPRYCVVSAFFRRLFPHDFDRVVPVVSHQLVDELLMRWDWHLARYEAAEAQLKARGKEPTERLGCCGLVGQQVHSLQYHANQLADLDRQICEARQRALDSAGTPACFVLFKTQAAAAIAASAELHAEGSRQFQVHPAPGPEEVNWQALWLDWQERELRATAVMLPLALVVLFPIGVFSGGLAQLNYVLCAGSEEHGLDMVWPQYCQQQEPWALLLKQLLTGFLPALLLNLWQNMVMPRLIYYLVQVEGRSFSLSCLDQRIATIFFYFDVANIFLGGVLGGSALQLLDRAICAPGQIMSLIGAAVPASSNFFLSYVAMRALLLVPMRLVIPHAGLWQYWLRCCGHLGCVVSSRQRADLFAPRSPRYGFEFGTLMLIYLIALAFSAVSPLILPAALLYFATAYVFWRYNLLYVYVRKYESGGRMFPVFFNQLCACLAVFHVFTSSVLLVKEGYWQGMMLWLTVPLAIFKFWSHCKQRFQAAVDALPLELAYKAPKAIVDSWVYLPPPLQERALGWHVEWMKAWEGWGMPAYSM